MEGGEQLSVEGGVMERPNHWGRNVGEMGSTVGGCLHG